MSLGFDRQYAPDKDVYVDRLAELRRVDSIYSAKLFQQTSFPSADEDNRKVEEWVEQVMKDWHLLCHSSRHEVSLGQDERQVISRNVLEFLFHAASKSFHSPLILRSLFQVHRFVGEHELAYRAFEVYLELVMRPEQMNESVPDISSDKDDKETIYSIVAEAIEGLCVSGRKEEAEKAFDLANDLTGWAKDYLSSTATMGDDAAGLAKSADNTTENTPENARKTRMLEVIQRSIAIATTCWASWTPEIENRSGYQKSALEIFNELNDSSASFAHKLSVRTVYSHALLLGQIGQSKQAIALVKQALADSSSDTGEPDDAIRPDLISLWHLLALLLSARSDWPGARLVCRTVLDQFAETDLLPAHSTSASSTVLLGQHDTGTTTPQAPSNLCDEMTSREKEALIETKMTELALIEAMEGPKKAINSSNEMLSLCSMFSRQLRPHGEQPPKKEQASVAKSSTGTISGFRSKVFGRKPVNSTVYKSSTDWDGTSSLPDVEHAQSFERPVDHPTIKVTPDSTSGGKKGTLRFWRSHSELRDEPVRNKLHKRPPPDLTGSQRNARSDRPRPASSLLPSPRDSFSGGAEARGVETSAASDPRSTGLSAAATQPSRWSMAEKLEPPHSGPPSDRGSMGASPDLPTKRNTVEQDEVDSQLTSGVSIGETSRPAIHPPASSLTAEVTETGRRSGRLAEQVHACSTLVKVWLLVAGLYRRASLYQDSQEACDEASKYASHFETVVGMRPSSMTNFARPWWAMTSSSNQWQADVCVERGHLAASKGSPHEAIQQFEEALVFSIHHPEAIVGLSNLLLDIFEGRLPPDVQLSGFDVNTANGLPAFYSNPPAEIPPAAKADSLCESGRVKAERDRHAARDRAFGLLSSLTKRGAGWDDPEVWFALSRAHQSSEQTEREKEILQWCIKLEERRPIRPWRSASGGPSVA